MIEFECVEIKEDQVSSFLLHYYKLQSLQMGVMRVILVMCVT